MENISNEEYTFFKNKIQFIDRAYTIFISSPLLFGFLILFYSETKKLGETNVDTQLLDWIAVSFFLFSFVVMLMRYLQVGLNSTKDERIKALIQRSNYIQSVRANDKAIALKEELSFYKGELRQVQNELEQISTKGVNINDPNVLKAVKDNIIEHSTDAILSEIKIQAYQQIENERIDYLVSDNSDRTIRRLLAEISALKLRRNLNLAFGIAISSLGIYFLASFVMKENKELLNWWQFMSYYLPNFSLVLFIQLFAFFFLRLYKSSLDEIKYFQNEITNIESKAIAINVAITTKNTEGLTSAIENLMNTERNFILEKGQTTVSLEKSKLETQTVTSLSNNLVNAISNKP